LPRLLPSLYEGVLPRQIEGMAEVYEITAPPPLKWRKVVERLIVDHNPYFNRHDLDPTDLIPDKYDPLKLSIARLTGKGEAAYRSRAGRADLNPLAPFLWQENGLPKGDPLAKVTEEALVRSLRERLLSGRRGKPLRKRSLER